MLTSQNTFQNSKSFRHFAKHLGVVGRVHYERKKAKEDVDSYLQRMRKSIIRMTLTYSDLDRLKEKIENLINWERKYAKYFKPEDKETLELKNQVYSLQQELQNEREEKFRLIGENDEKIKQLTASLENVKNQMKSLLMERAKRHQRLRALETKIGKNVDVHGYYHS